MVPIVARALILLAVAVILLALGLLLPGGTSSGGRPVLKTLLVVAALILGVFVLLMVPFAGP
jgi:hypothetical protein